MHAIPVLPDEAPIKTYIFNRIKSDRVLSHHTDDLINAGNQYNVEMLINRYSELSHTEIMFVYPDEFLSKIVPFFRERLN